MRAKFVLQIVYQLTKWLFFFRHDVRQQKSVKNAIALGKEAAVSNATGFFSPHQNFPFHHEIGDVFETDGGLVQLASMLGGNAVHHAGSVEGANHVARPLLANQEPVQKYRHALVRIDETTVFGDRANAIGVAIRRESGMAFLFYYRLLKHGDVGKNRLRINARKQWIHFLADCDVANPIRVEYLW